MSFQDIIASAQSDYHRMMDVLLLVTVPQLLLAIIAVCTIVWLFNRAKGAVLVASSAGMYLVPLLVHGGHLL